VLLIAVLHVIPDDDVAKRIVTQMRDAVPAGSYLAISHAVSDLQPEKLAQLAALYQDKVIVGQKRRANLRSRAEVEPYFDGLEMVEPGIVYLPEWRPEAIDLARGLPEVWAVGGVGRKA